MVNPLELVARFEHHPTRRKAESLDQIDVARKLRKILAVEDRLQSLEAEQTPASSECRPIERVEAPSNLDVDQTRLKTLVKLMDINGVDCESRPRQRMTVGAHRRMHLAQLKQRGCSVGDSTVSRLLHELSVFSRTTTAVLNHYVLTARPPSSAHLEAR
ncbi:MAG: hypothetical protein JWN99_2271 [Ilumatobacteraceae bacterium]|nr:hypothetical protein [Ilumatobacteraceae bacterium]